MMVSSYGSFDRAGELSNGPDGGELTRLIVAGQLYVPRSPLSIVSAQKSLSRACGRSRFAQEYVTSRCRTARTLAPALRPAKPPPSFAPANPAPAASPPPAVPAAATPLPPAPPPHVAAAQLPATAPGAGDSAPTGSPPPSAPPLPAATRARQRRPQLPNPLPRLRRYHLPLPGTRHRPVKQIRLVPHRHPRRVVIFPRPRSTTVHPTPPPANPHPAAHSSRAACIFAPPVHPSAPPPPAHPDSRTTSALRRHRRGQQCPASSPPLPTRSTAPSPTTH